MMECAGVVQIKETSFFVVVVWFFWLAIWKSPVQFVAIDRIQIYKLK